MTWDFRNQVLALGTVCALGGCGGGGGSAGPPPAPTVMLAKSAPEVATNGSVTLTWTSTNAASCTASGSWTGTLAPSGSRSIVVTQMSTYSISCTGGGGSATASAIVTVSPMLLAVTVRYQAPGPPVVNAAGTYYVPDWANPIAAPVPFVYVEIDDPTGKAVQSAYADASGVVHFSGLDPRVTYTPQVRSQINNPALGVDFVVLNNTAPIDTSQGTFRARYPVYSASFPAYTPTNLVNQVLTLTAPDGWSASSAKLVDASRVAGPYELLAFASFEAQTVSAANGGLGWNPLTILWSVKNKGGLAAPPDNYDQGIVTVGSGAFYTGGHNAIDASGADTGAPVAEDYIYLSGDQTFEAQDIYPTLMTHEMGHFAQTLFSTRQSPGGSHTYDDYEDPTQAWIEGNASGISALVMNTPTQNRLVYLSGEIIVGIFDISNNTISGNPQNWPIGWYQETTTTALMWAVYDPKGAMRLSAAATLAPMFSASWAQGPWLNTVWAYSYLLKQSNPTKATAIDAWNGAHHIVSLNNDVWGSGEVDPGDRTPLDSLPPYTTVAIGQTLQVCSAGALLEFNKEGNSRFLFLHGDGASHTLTVHGPSGTVPIVGRNVSLVTPGSTTFTLSGVVPAQGLVVPVGDCGVVVGEFSSQTAACSDPAPPAEQCWTVTWQ